MLCSEGSAIGRKSRSWVHCQTLARFSAAAFLSTVCLHMLYIHVCFLRPYFSEDRLPVTLEDSPTSLNASYLAKPSMSPALVLYEIWNHRDQRKKKIHTTCYVACPWNILSLLPNRCLLSTIIQDFIAHEGVHVLYEPTHDKHKSSTENRNSCAKDWAWTQEKNKKSAMALVL